MKQIINKTSLYCIIPDGEADEHRRGDDKDCEFDDAGQVHASPRLPGTNDQSASGYERCARPAASYPQKPSALVITTGALSSSGINSFGQDKGACCHHGIHLGRQCSVSV